MKVNKGSLTDKPRNYLHISGIKSAKGKTTDIVCKTIQRYRELEVGFLTR